MTEASGAEVAYDTTIDNEAITPFEGAMHILSGRSISIGVREVV